MGEWKPNFKQVIKTEEYVVWFHRLYEEDWGYMGMSDYPSEEPTDEYMVEVVRWRTDKWGRQIADHVSESCKAYGDKNLMNMLWWNFKNNPPSYATVKDYFATMFK